MSTTTVQATIRQPCKILSAHGLPEQLIRDNGPQFLAEEFMQFARQASSNSETEQLVETLSWVLPKQIQRQQLN